jgi:type I restriction enzyme S subunit
VSWNLKENWSVDSLGNLSISIDYGHTASATVKNTETKFLRITDIQDNFVDWQSVPFCICSEQERKRYELFDGDIVFARTGATTGKSYLINHCPPNSVFASYLIRVRPNNQIYPKYLFQYFQTSDYWRQISSRSSGTAQAGVNATKLASLQIPLPPLPEQKRIAEVLDQADALREKRRLALQKLDALTNSIFIEMFGDPVKNPKGWERFELKEIGKVTTGSTPSSELPNMFGGEIPFVTPSDLERTDKKVNRTLTESGGKQSRIVRKGSTLVCCIGATIGKVGKAYISSAFNQQINAIEWNEKMNDDFGYHILKFYKPIVAKLGASTTLPILKKSSFEKIRFPLPPIELQNKFAEIVQKIEALKAEKQKSAEKIENLFQSLQQRAFKGELFASEIVEPESEIRQPKLF